MQPAFEQALRQGEIAHAIEIAHQWAQSLISQGMQPDQAGIEIARAAAGIYRELVTEPVHQFLESAAASLPPGVGSIVERALKRLMDMVYAWEQRLELVYRERLARELRDFTRARNVPAAVQNIRILCASGRSNEDFQRLAQYCGNVLGTCDNHPHEVDEVLKALDRNPELIGLNHQLVEEMARARAKRLEMMMKSRIETREIEWVRALTDTVVEIKNQLPSANRMDEPDEALLRDVGDLFRSILRIPLWRGQPEKWIDAILLLVEYVPKELAQAAAQSGIEQRAYMTLGYTAKKAVLLTFGELGKLDALTGQLGLLAQSLTETPYLKFAVELMGAMRSPAFYPFLVACLEQKKFAAIQGELIDALGNLGNADARNLLLGALGDTLSARVIDPPRVRHAQRIFSALGKLSKSPRLTLAERTDLIRRALKALPKDQSRLLLSAALQFFSYNPGPLPPDLKAWAVGALSSALWLPDDAPDWAQGGERQSSILGFRQPIVEALKVLAPEAPAPFIEIADAQSMRYGSAFAAIAEICEKTKLEQSLPILERMLLNALLFDDSDRNKYQKEQYWDAAAQQKVDLGKEKVVAPIVYAIGTIGGQDALRILMNFDDQVKSGRMEIPGTETARHLDHFLRELSGGTAGAGLSGALGSGPSAALPPMDPARLDELVKALRGSYFLTGAEKRRMKKITAIGELSRHLPAEAVEPLIEQLNDKDSMVQGAARSALAEYMSRRNPPPERGKFLGRIINALGDPDPAIRQGAAGVIREIGPMHPDVQPVLMRQKDIATDKNVRMGIEAILRDPGSKRLAAGGPMAGMPGGVKQGAAQGMPGMSSGNLPGAAGAPGAETPDAASDTAASKSISILELKRQYVLARQEWIRTGKKGPPPEPPPGV